MRFILRTARFIYYMFRQMTSELNDKNNVADR